MQGARGMFCPMPGRVGPWKGGLCLLVLAFSLLLSGMAAAEDRGLWQALRDGGHLALMRHALAPGTGDPENFALDDCATQRNLSDEGQAQARRIGDRFRANGIAAASVYTSQWCRCRETAALLGLGAAHDLPALNSFFQRAGRRGPQTESLRRWIAAQALTGPPVVLVTHQVNITALTDRYAGSGEMVVVKRLPGGGLQVVGTLETE